jgi:hypothetical protein
MCEYEMYPRWATELREAIALAMVACGIAESVGDVCFRKGWPDA